MQTPRKKPRLSGDDLKELRNRLALLVSKVDGRDYLLKAASDEHLFRWTFNCLESLLSLKIDEDRVTIPMANEYIGTIDYITDDLGITEDILSSHVGQKLVNCFPRMTTPHSNHRNTAIEEVLFEESFRIPYNRRGRGAQWLLRHIEHCLSIYDESVYYSPYVAVINSSMTGKSRMFAEIIKSGIFVINICFQNNADSYPLRSPVVANWLIQASTTEAMIGAFLVCCVERLVQWLSDRATLDWAHAAIDFDEYHRTETFWKEVTGAAVRMAEMAEFKRFEGRMTKALESLSNLEETITKQPHSGNLRIVFFFDEARDLVGNRFEDKPGEVTRFHLVRRCMRNLLPSHGRKAVFGCFADTLSRVSNFAPPERINPSMRVAPTGKNLFPPFWWLPCMDVWSDCGKEHTVETLSDMTMFSIFGRPAYHAYVLAVTPSRKTDVHVKSRCLAFLNILENKILDKRPSDFVANATRDAALAVLCVRMSLNVCPSSRLAVELTSSHMRLCVGISSDRDSVYTFQCAEPCLALAAMRLTLKVDWKVYLDHLRSAITDVFVNAGHRGELAGQILALMAFDRVLLTQLRPAGSFEDQKNALRQTTRIPLSPLFDVLCILVGGVGSKELEELKLATQDMYVRVLQFVQFFKKPDSVSLAEMFARAAGIVCSFCAPAADLIVPVLKCERGEDPMTVKVEPGRMTALLIQIKCLSNRPGKSMIISVATSKLSIEQCVDNVNTAHPYVSLFLELGHRPKPDVARAKNVFIGPGGLPPFEERQIPVAVISLKPSDILDEGYSKDVAEIDKSFNELVTARADALNISGSCNDAKDCCADEMLNCYLSR